MALAVGAVAGVDDDRDCGAAVVVGVVVVTGDLALCMVQRSVAMPLRSVVLVGAAVICFGASRCMRNVSLVGTDRGPIAVSCAVYGRNWAMNERSCGKRGICLVGMVLANCGF